MDPKKLQSNLRGFLRMFEKNSEILETIEGKIFDINTPTKRNSKFGFFGEETKQLKRKSVFTKEMVQNNLEKFDKEFLLETGTKVVY